MEKNKFIELEKMDAKRPFVLPENYFDDFANHMDDLVFKTLQETKRPRLRPWMYAAAASLIGIVFLGQIYMTSNKNEKLALDAYETYILSQVSENSIIDYYLIATENEK